MHALGILFRSRHRPRLHTPPILEFAPTNDRIGGCPWVRQCGGMDALGIFFRSRLGAGLLLRPRIRHGRAKNNWQERERQRESTSLWCEGFALSGHVVLGCVNAGQWMLWEYSSAVVVAIASIGHRC
jgi:hypothetical protein